MPEPNALMAKIIAVMIIIARRPNLSASGPAASAPKAQPSNTDATLKPVATLLELNALPSADTVPLITPESKPNKKPPIAATAEIKIT